MDERSLGFVNQLIEKTEQGKLQWSTGFEDGQFKTIVPEGDLVFVVQANPEMRKFMILDNYQDVILEEEISPDVLQNVQIQANQPKLIMLYNNIGQLQNLVRASALKVNEKLEKAEKFLSAI